METGAPSLAGERSSRFSERCSLKGEVCVISEDDAPVCVIYGKNPTWWYEQQDVKVSAKQAVISTFDVQRTLSIGDG